jgi:nitrite reductase (NADH) small subunit
VDGIAIGLLRRGPKVYAVRNICPHQGAEICKGKVRGTWAPSSPGELIYSDRELVAVCPWHGFEYSLATGYALYGVTKGKLRLYPVIVQNGIVCVRLRDSQ